VERERRRAEREAMKMDVDGDGDGNMKQDVNEEIPTCLCWTTPTIWGLRAYPPTFYADTSIEAPPSVWPQKHYCDITGLEVGSILHSSRVGFN
jgi:INO80 complex subunit C